MQAYGRIIAHVQVALICRAFEDVIVGEISLIADRGNIFQIGGQQRAKPPYKRTKALPKMLAKNTRVLIQV